MIILECSKCNKTRKLDEDSDDEVQNAFMEGWEFSLWMDTETICPRCNFDNSIRIEELKF